MARLSMNSNLNLSLKLYHKTKSNVFLSHIGDISIDIHYVYWKQRPVHYSKCVLLCYK